MTRETAPGRARAADVVPQTASDAGAASVGGPARLPALDMLRGIAVLAVFLQHLGDRFRPFVLERAGRTLPGPVVGWLGIALPRAHWGVDLFFVLSGFTLGMGFARDRARGVRRSAAEFLARRAARILPGFYLAVLVHLALRTELLAAPRLGAALAAHLLLLQGYLSPGKLTIIGASWSLTTESQFYLVTPWLGRRLLGSSRAPARPAAPNARRRIVLAVAGLCLVAWVLRGALHDWALLPSSGAGMLELTQRRLVLCRLDQFVLGFGAALLVERASARRPPPPLLAAALVVAGIVALAAAVPFDAATWARTGGNPAYACVSLGMTLLVVGAAWLPRNAPRLLEPLRGLGVVSYGVFLYHQLALELTERWVPVARERSWTGLGVAAACALVLAALAGAASWYLVEARALALVSRRFRGRRSTGSDHASTSGPPR